MTVSADTMDDRRIALTAATALYASAGVVFGGPTDNERLLTTATAVYQWLTGPVAMFLEFGPVRDQTTGEPTGATIGGSMTQMRDGDEVDLRLTEKDAKGAVIIDDPNLTWTSSDDTVITIAASTQPGDVAGTVTVRGGLPGSAVATAQSGNITFTQAFDIVPGDVALMDVTVGDIRPQAPPV